MNYKKRYEETSGYTPLCTEGDSSLKTLEFGIISIKAGEEVHYKTAEKEAALVLLGGRCTVYFSDGSSFENIGGRRSVFEGKAHCIYLPRRTDVVISTDWSVKIAVSATFIDVDTTPQVITPDKVRVLTLGQRSFERETHFIVDGSTNARHLTIGEAFITPGNWAGFPPHKHDANKMPAEGVLEEIYYFLFQPSQGFALQRLYTSDGSLDECYVVKQDELVEFPYGYHTTVGAPGYNTYFLWAMAGDCQGFFRSNDPDHEWVSAVENLLKKTT
ncbi:MAG: 5-deoxy-glucuronate isomerase [Sphaerochaeta sp.]|jgi:5-deoxy-glucuronate isomerase|nr:5-deoxy-glucuronate isomerase [Sphaerochaeta sp.]